MRKEYTHVRLEMPVYDTIKINAFNEKMSVSRYIEKLLSQRLTTVKNEIIIDKERCLGGIANPVSRKGLEGSSPSLVVCFSNKQDNQFDNVANNNVKDFENFLFLKKNLSETTIKGYIRHLKVLEQEIGKPAYQMAQSDVERFLLNIKQSNSPKTFNNYLCMSKAYFRDFLKKDYVNDFKHPNSQIKPKILPSKSDLSIFFDALPSMKYKVVFLALASSGLRISELLDANIDRNNRMIIPKSHTGNTKKSWISFFNGETANLMKQFKGNPFETSRNTVAHVFKKVSNGTDYFN